MTAGEVCFWFFTGCVVYPYVVYPLIVSLAARFAGRPVRRIGLLPRSFSLIVAAHNEETRVESRLAELQGLIVASGLEGEIILVSDGSTDETVLRARRVATDGTRILELATRVGKAQALSRAAAVARHEVLVFADMRQTWAPAALGRLLANFADPAVGAATGELVLESGPGVLAGVGMYWRFEKWLRRQESRFHSTVGATGAISAVRRSLFPGIPEGTLLDDVYWPLHVAMQGHRVVFDETARAFDRLPPRPADEFRRKVRTLCGNFQLLNLLPVALVPGRNPVWFQFVSHKLLRLVVPWALLAVFALSAVLPGRLYALLFWTQVAAYLLAVSGLLVWGKQHSRLANAAAAFVLLNSAAWVAFWVWCSGRAHCSWTPVAYGRLPAAYPVR